MNSLTNCTFQLKIYTCQVFPHSFDFPTFLLIIQHCHLFTISMFFFWNLCYLFCIQPCNHKSCNKNYQRNLISIAIKNHQKLQKKVQCACISAKVVYPKYFKHWLSTVAHTIDYVCSKISNHGLSFSLFRFFWEKPF